MFQRKLLIGLMSVVVSASAACDADVEQVTARTGSGSCSMWRCGFNAADANGRSLQELHLGGQPNSDGVKLVGFVAPPLTLLGGYTLAVENDELVARRGASKLRRQQLVGSTILVQVQLGLVLPITIAGYEAVPSWADGGAPISAYTLVYPEVSALLGVKNVCSGSLLDPLAAAVTVLGGETYDAASKTVEPGRTGWFTLACAGSAAAKIKLLGYGPQSKFPGTNQPASVAARQATLKMLTADYCGHGHSYTANGTPVVWQNHAGTVDSSDLHTPDAVEAVWTANGAVCLDATRLTDAAVACELPTCAGLDLSAGTEWITHTVLAE